MTWDIHGEDSSGLMPKRNPPHKKGLLSLALIWMVCFLIGQLLVFPIANLFDIEIEDLANASYENISLGALRTIIFVSTAFSFFVPALVFAAYYYRTDIIRRLHLFSPIPWRMVWIGSAFIVVSSPILLLLTKINTAISLPEWLSFLDTSDYKMVERILEMPHIGHLLINILIIAVTPALGEEIIFRRLIQSGLQRIVDNPHIGIVLAGLVFSIIHLQFDGLLARWYLGVVLGYAYWFSQNLWISIFLHFFNNAFQVVLAYLNPDIIDSVSDPASQELPIAAYIFSGLAVIVISYFVIRRKNQTRQSI